MVEHMFNFSVMNEVVPNSWKLTLIMSIPKSNIMPYFSIISILPTVSKALERIVSDEILDYLRVNDLTDPYHFANRKNSSTNMHYKNTG